MTTVLVVDDSAVDRCHVGDLLRRDARLETQFAVDGADALAKMEASPPDLVVTDLIMPRMDGLELVAAIRARYPLVPVILVTSQGSEEIAVRALQAGAASYVPKRMAAQSLLETIESVTAVSSRQRYYTRLMGCMTKNNCTFVLENDLALTRPLVAYLQETLGHIGLCNEADRTRIGVALEEALSNALFHGNLGLHSDLKERDEDAYYALVRQRRQQPPYRDRRIHVATRLSTEQAVFEIRDEGAGFDPRTLSDPTDPANLEKLSGRGVLLMRTFMDEVVYNDVGNVVTMTRRRGP
jgi:CheY-like chemotaxis protein/anti-sigma regulatory factor (Ser/Thr protein kinase)